MAQEAQNVTPVALAKLKRSPYQPRTRPIQKKDLVDLMTSLAAVGQTSPIVIQPVPGDDGGYHVHQGERRWAAARHLGWDTIDALIRPDLDERSARCIALADNLGREDLTAWDQARALRDYAAIAQATFEQSASELGLSKATAYRLKTIASASEAMQSILETTDIGIRPSDLLVREEAKNGKRALRLAKKYAAGEMTLVQLESEMSSKPSSLRTIVRKPIELAQDNQSVRLRVALNHRLVTDETRLELLRTLQELLRLVGVHPMALANGDLSPSVSAGDCPTRRPALDAVADTFSATSG